MNEKSEAAGFFDCGGFTVPHGPNLVLILLPCCRTGMYRCASRALGAARTRTVGHVRSTSVRLVSTEREAPKDNLTPEQVSRWL